MKRILALLLCTVLLLTVFPVSASADKTEPKEDEIYVYTEADNALIDEDVFASIEEVKLEAAQACGGIQNMTEQDYIALIPRVIEKIEASSTYVEGSLQQNGNFLVWQTTVGIPCCYDPRMEAELHNTQNDPTPEQVAQAEAEAEALLEELRSVRGGWPGTTNIGLIQPYWESSSNYEDYTFNTYSPAYKAMWQALYETTGGQGMRYTMYNATVDNIALTVQSCGIVIFDSHGTTDYSGSGGDYTSRANSSYLCLITNQGVTSEDTAAQTGPYGTYYHCIKGSGYAYVDGTCIGNHMTQNAQNSLVYMGICLGMATDGMFSGLRAKGVEVVWGYSQSVTFVGEREYMQTILGYVKEGDEYAEAVSKAKDELGDWDPAYSNYSESQARANHVAFPICVSSEDDYPGHGNVDYVQNVYSTWTLFPQFNITAVSNNDEWGTVSASGRNITATPATGYEIVGYEVLNGTATVTQNGNKFLVTAETDCTIQINFAPRVPATVTYSVPDGVSCEPFAGYVGDSYVLPTPTGTPTGNAHNYAFLGWTTAPVENDVTELPSFQKAGKELTVAVPETTYYALYSYFIAEDGFTEGEFTLVTSAPSSWAGDYVITYQGQKVLDASGANTGVAVSTAVRDLADIGGVLTGNVLSNISDDYIYTVEEAGNGTYTLKMKEQDCWLALMSDANTLTTTDNGDAETSCWTLSVTSEGVRIASAAYPARAIRFNDRSNAFRCYKNGQKQISVYAAAQGTKWYTTQPKDRVECETHTFTDWTTTVAPTCTEPGLQKRVCTVCGYSETEELDPLGHDYAAGEPVAPTCTEQGYTTYTCTRCQDSYNDDFVDALGHDYAEEVTAPTCTEGGFTTHTCTRCGDSYTDTETDPLGHDFGEWTVTTPPTCTEAGEETRTCSRCDAAETRAVDALGHDFAEEVTAPTCTEGGFTTHTCTRCGDSFVDNEIDALGHAWDEGTVVTEPTETEPGVKRYTCTRCGAVRDEEIPAEPHDCPCKDFEDMPEYGTPEHEAIDWAYTHGITKGVTATQFGVGKTLTRAQAATFLYAAAGKPEFDAENAANPFSDVPSGSWFTNPVLWAASEGIVSGYSDGTFKPNGTLSRAQILVILYAQAGKPDMSGYENPYSDVPASGWFTNAALWAYYEGIERGEDGVFAQSTPCTREVFVLYLYRNMTGSCLLGDE